jgi:hypothetical protein
MRVSSVVNAPQHPPKLAPQQVSDSHGSVDARRCDGLSSGSCATQIPLCRSHRVFLMCLPRMFWNLCFANDQRPSMVCVHKLNGMIDSFVLMNHQRVVLTIPLSAFFGCLRRLLLYTVRCLELSSSEDNNSIM